MTGRAIAFGERHAPRRKQGFVAGPWRSRLRPGEDVDIGAVISPIVRFTPLKPAAAHTDESRQGRTGNLGRGKDEQKLGETRARPFARPPDETSPDGETCWKP